MKKTISLVLSLLLIVSLLAACGSTQPAPAPAPAVSAAETAPAASTEPTAEPSPEPTEEPVKGIDLPDGVYSAEFVTDSSMFHANETCDGKGVLTVKDGEAVFHVSLASKGILNLFVGTAEDAQKDDAVWLEHTEDEITYPDGLTETVYGFDIPLTVLDEDFSLALIGKKDKWYDHTVSVRNAEPLAEDAALSETDSAEVCGVAKITETDGEYLCNVTLEGGSGKAKIDSPAKISISDEKTLAVIVWSSKNYDYMLIDGEKYLPLEGYETSAFEIPVVCFDEAFTVIADTVAMSTPHEIEYTLCFDSDSLEVCE